MLTAAIAPLSRAVVKMSMEKGDTSDEVPAFT